MVEKISSALSMVLCQRITEEDEIPEGIGGILVKSFSAGGF